MKKRTRTIALLLSLIMTAGALASCADNEPVKKPQVTAGNNSEGDKKNPTFAEMDYNGETFTILSKQDEDTDFTDHYIDTEDRTGEPINEAVATRNELVEEKYNVDIVRRKGDYGYAKTAAQSGTVDFEMVYDWGFRLVPGAMDGIFYDLKQLNPEYVDLEQSYWAPTSHNDLTIADKLLVFTCDISMNRIGWASFLAFNKKLMDDFGLEYPYTYVNNNTWTYDKYLELVQQGFRENGDTKLDENDIYGSSGVGITDVVRSSGWKGYKYRDDGSFELDFQLEKLSQIYSEYSNKFRGDTFCNVKMEDWLKIVDKSAFSSDFRAARFASFGQNHIMFTSFTMDETQDLAGMDLNSTYGVVPMPKYQANQSEYYHYIDPCAPMFSIMKQADDEKIAVILEYMNYESQNLLLPAFFEQTIKTKRMSDPEGRDEKMLDIIRDSVHYDFGSLYGQNGILKPDGKQAWNPIGTMLGDMMAAGQFSSVYNKYSAAAQKALDDFYDKILQMDLNK